MIIVGLGAWLIWEWSNMMNCTSTYQKHALVNSYHCLTILRHCMMVVLGQVHCQYNGRMIHLVLSKVFGPMVVKNSFVFFVFDSFWLGIKEGEKDRLTMKIQKM